MLYSGNKKYLSSAIAPKNVSSFHTLGGECVIHIQPTRCVLGGKSQVKAITLFLTPPFRTTPIKAKGVNPIKLLRLLRLSVMVMNELFRSLINKFNTRYCNIN